MSIAATVWRSGAMVIILTHIKCFNGCGILVRITRFWKYFFHQVSFMFAFANDAPLINGILEFFFCLLCCPRYDPLRIRQSLKIILYERIKVFRSNPLCCAYPRSVSLLLQGAPLRWRDHALFSIAYRITYLINSSARSDCLPDRKMPSPAPIIQNSARWRVVYCCFLLWR